MSDVSDKITATDVRLAIRKHYSSPAWAVFDEVASEVGWKEKRWIDCVALGVWQSTGNEIIGIEIKVSRGDLRRELQNPQKTEEWMRYCDRFYLACPAGVASAADVPATWGLLSMQERGNVRVAKKAPKLEPQPMTRGFIGAMLRRAGEADAELISAAVTKALREQRERDQSLIDDRLTRERDRLRREDNDAKEKLDEIMRIVGPDRQWLNSKEIGLAIKAVLDAGVIDIYGAMRSHAEQLRAAADKVEKSLAAVGAPTREEIARLKGKLL